MKSGAHCSELAMADFGRDPRSSDSLRGSRNVVFYVNNARFHRFPVGQILRHLNTATSIGVAKNCSQNFHVWRFQAALTPQ